jgi:hypothetical protein
VRLFVCLCVRSVYMQHPRVVVRVAPVRSAFAVRVRVPHVPVRADQRDSLTGHLSRLALACRRGWTAPTAAPVQPFAAPFPSVNRCRRTRSPSLPRSPRSAVRRARAMTSAHDRFTSSRPSAANRRSL